MSENDHKNSHKSSCKNSCKNGVQKADLHNVNGVGDKLVEKIYKSVGGEDELQKIVKNLDLESLINIEGISQRKAIEIMNQLLGNPTQEFLKSERAVQLYEEIIQKKSYLILTLNIQKIEFSYYLLLKINL